jgi:hypothetical protein
MTNRFGKDRSGRRVEDDAEQERCRNERVHSTDCSAHQFEFTTACMGGSS